MAEPIRVATWHGDFSRKGPGLLVRELAKPDEVPGLAEIAAARADVLLLTDMDFDAGQVALALMRDRLSELGLTYPHLLTVRPNTGLATAVDIDGDGLRGGPRDAQGYGYFAGQGGQALLSRFPLELLQDKTDVLWRDIPDGLMAADDPNAADQRLASSAFWAVGVDAPTGSVTLLTLAATPPVFDGPEDRNGRRNHDEVLYWPRVLDQHPDAVSQHPKLLIGHFNLDPDRGDGLRGAVQEVLGKGRFQDPLPRKITVSWPRAGDMRVSYVLPDKNLTVIGAGVRPVVPDAGLHRLVWVDLEVPGPVQSPAPRP